MEIVPYNGTTLAFIGDAVMTLWVRELLVSKGYQKPNDLQKLTSKYVSAKAQAYYLTQLIDKNYFDENELEIIKRGRNAQTKTIAKNADVITYRLATGFEGVSQAFAIQSGREVRVMVVPDKVDDLKAFKIARDLKEKIENELTYPGQIKVTVIREVRANEVAK